jgi:hypothetical protein
VTVNETVTNSNANEHSWGAKVSGAYKWTEYFTLSLEATHGGKFTDTNTNAKGSIFTIGASMPIQLPPNVGYVYILAQISPRKETNISNQCHRHATGL